MGSNVNTLQVLATDPESGEVVKASIDIEVLQKGNALRSELTMVRVVLYAFRPSA